MVKTRSDLKGVRVSGKAPRKMPVLPSNSPSGGRSTKKYNGTNSICPREVPAWQKKITCFFPSKENAEIVSEEMPGSSTENADN